MTDTAAIVAKLNAASISFLRVKAIRSGGLRGCWRVTGPGCWTIKLAEQFHALGFRDFDGTPPTERSGHAGSFDVHVRPNPAAKKRV